MVHTAGGDGRCRAALQSPRLTFRTHPSLNNALQSRQTAWRPRYAAHALTCYEHEREEQAGGGKVGVRLRAHEAAVCERRRGEEREGALCRMGGQPTSAAGRTISCVTSRAVKEPRRCPGDEARGVDGRHAAGRGRAPVVQRRRNLFEKEQEVIPEKHGSHVLRRGCCCCCCCCCWSEHLTQSSCW